MRLLVIGRGRSVAEGPWLVAHILCRDFWMMRIRCWMSGISHIGN